MNITEQIDFLNGRQQALLCALLTMIERAKKSDQALAAQLKQAFESAESTMLASAAPEPLLSGFQQVSETLLE